MLSVDFRPQHAFSPAGLIFNLQQCKFITLLGSAYLQLCDYAPQTYPGAATQSRKIRRSDRLQISQHFNVTLQRVSGNVKTKSRFLRGQKLGAAPSLRSRWHFVNQQFLRRRSAEE